MNRYFEEQEKRSKMTMHKLRGKSLKTITTGMSNEIILEFMDSTKASIEFTTYPDGTIRDLIIEEEK